MTGRPARDRPLAAVLSIERRRAARRLERLSALRSEIEREVLGRSGPVDVVEPERRGRWWLAARIPHGRERAVHARSSAASGSIPPTADEFWSAPVEVLLDESTLRGRARVGRLECARDGDRVAYTVDRTGSERFDLVVGGRLRRRGVAPDFVLSDDGSSVIAVELAADGRPATAVELGASRGRRELATEPDPERWFEVSAVGGRVILASRSLDGDRLSLLTDDGRPIPLPVDGTDARALPLPGDRLLLLADGKLSEWAPGTAPRPIDLGLPPGASVEGAVTAGGTVVLQLRVAGDPVLAWFDATATDGGPARVVLRRPARPGETLDVLGADGDVVRGAVTSLVLPPLRWEFDSGDRALSVGLAPPARGRQLRLRATGDDGTGIPVTIAVPDDDRPGEPRPLVLLVYGAYGVPFEARYSPGTQSLLDRGALLAIAHVRGGGELGAAWHDAARGLRKHVSVDDYLAVARHLVDEGWTRRGLIVAQGSSAGATVVGSALNRDPALFAGAVVSAPFVDPLGALLDGGSALAAVDVPEWGDPRTEAGHRALRALSPLHGVRLDERYPPVLATAGIHDPRAPVRSVIRWVDRLREAGCDATLLLDPGGHDGPTNRSAERERFATELAWMLDVLGLA